jgi:hypothetical protein
MATLFGANEQQNEWTNLSSLPERRTLLFKSMANRERTPALHEIPFILRVAMDEEATRPSSLPDGNWRQWARDLLHIPRHGEEAQRAHFVDECPLAALALHHLAHMKRDELDHALMAYSTWNKALPRTLTSRVLAAIDKTDDMSASALTTLVSWAEFLTTSHETMDRMLGSTSGPALRRECLDAVYELLLDGGLLPSGPDDDEHLSDGGNSALFPSSYACIFALTALDVATQLEIVTPQNRDLPAFVATYDELMTRALDLFTRWPRLLRESGAAVNIWWQIGHWHHSGRVPLDDSPAATMRRLRFYVGLIADVRQDRHAPTSMGTTLFLTFGNTICVSFRIVLRWLNHRSSSR